MSYPRCNYFHIVHSHSQFLQPTKVRIVTLILTQSSAGTNTSNLSSAVFNHLK